MGTLRQFHDGVAAVTAAADAGSAEALRAGLVAELRGLGAVRTEAVAAAVGRVARHVFVPELTVERAYEAERSYTTKRDSDGVALSSVSAARIQAFMLEQARIEPGARVLEIGSGGYNAALIAELVGEAGEVTTIDIDPDVVGRARRLLAAAGYGQVNVVLADGAAGEPGHAPYDRIVVTVEAADLATAWVDQLAPNGRLVVPLRVRGLNRSIAFQCEGGQLVGRDYEVCGFVPMRGVGEDPEDLVVLHDGQDEQVGLRLPDHRRVDAARLRDALATPAVWSWSGVSMERGMSYDDLDLWLAAALPDYALLAATAQARQSGVVASWSPMGVSALLDGAGVSFAYLAMRPTNAERSVFEFGAVGHGLDAQTLADRLGAEIQTWDRAHRGDRAEFRAYPADTPDEDLPEAGCVLDREPFRITISWPARPCSTSTEAGQGL